MIAGAMIESSGRYRLRTWLRRNLPSIVSARIPKGPKDCGNHEWYRQDADHDACYHCVTGRRRRGPVGTPSPRIAERL